MTRKVPVDDFYNSVHSFVEIEIVRYISETYVQYIDIKLTHALTHYTTTQNIRANQIEEKTCGA